MTAETLRDAYIADLTKYALDPSNEPVIRARLDAIIAAARAESDALRAENERLRADLRTFTEEPGILARVGAEHTRYWYEQTRIADRKADSLRAELEALAAEWESGEHEQDIGTEGRWVLMVTARRIRLALARAALAPSPAEPAAPVAPCPDGDSCPDARRYGKVHPSPAEPAAPEREP